MIKRIPNVKDIILDGDSPYTRTPNITKAFYTWDTQNLWIDMKIRKNPILTKFKIAKTYLGREISILKLSTGKKKMAVFLLGGEDAKDWMSPAILLNFIDYVLEQKQDVDTLTKDYDFYILPVLNPDGYDYNIKEDWSWGRNRRVYFPKKMCSQNDSALGVNLDRNWFSSKDFRELFKMSL
ncbi:unnamed protein product [Chrysodeixis includens]|uniref:Peptidase M14 domain-containing protein n=1 Tax=Chrysodeixis includens TaxID=689277 RepID=A0A9P0FXK0_CHRIL|nr:unnamed protein product [Chrysodeixis includens]